MDKIKKAFWFSLILTGAGQLYLGERKKGGFFLLVSLGGVIIACIGAVFIVNILWELAVPVHYKFFFSLGIFLSIIGLALIIISGYKSIKDITSRGKNVQGH